jgi:hypothetical protein
MAIEAIVSAVVAGDACRALSAPGWTGRSGTPRRLWSARTAAASWMPRSSRGMTAAPAMPPPRPRTQLPQPPATVSLCDAFSASLRIRNGLGTNRGRIADSPRSPVPFPATCRGTRAGCALDGVFTGRTSGGARAQSVKLGTARSRIRIGEESNGFTAGPAARAFRQNNPMQSRNFRREGRVCSTVRKRRSRGGLPARPMDCPWGAARDRPSPLQGRVRCGRPKLYCVLATLGGWAEVMKLVASSIAGPSGVGTFTQNGTRMRVPAIGAKAISMLRWAARYLMTGRSGM